MAKQTIDIGTSANDGTGSTLRAAFDITNDNFTELYDGTGGLLHKIEGTNFTGSLLIGHSTTGTLSSAQNNTGIGIGALDALTSGDHNVAIGKDAGTSISSGSGNITIGYQAGHVISAGVDNIAIGRSALGTEDGHGRNIAIGRSALENQNAGTDAYNVAIGYHAGIAVTTGTRNTAVGGESMGSITVGNRNVAIGYRALFNEDEAERSTAVGYEALKDQNFNGSNAYNTALGYNSGSSVSTGKQNTIIGALSGDALTTGDNNIIIGYDAAASAVDVSNEVTIGNSSIANVRIPSDSTLKIGASGDLQLEHVSSNSFIKNTAVGDLYIENQVDDKDIIIRCDDGSGGLDTYMVFDGSNNRINVAKPFKITDNTTVNIGSGLDLRLFHNGTDSKIQNETGNLVFEQNANDSDIIFKSDDGSGGSTEYVRIDGSANKTLFFQKTEHQDSVKAEFGNSGDLQIQHTGTTGIIDNQTGDLIIKVSQDDGDIIFQSDNGSGAIDTYFRLDGGDERTEFEKEARFLDSAALKIGSSGDLALSHDGSNTRIENFTGALKIIQNTDDGDIEFFCDDGSGGIAEYFKLDGSQATGGGTLFTKWGDNSYISLGDGSDLYFFHNGTDTKMQNQTGDLVFEQTANDKDILFKSDDGSGGTATYFFLDGSADRVQFNKNLRIVDTKELSLGSSDDLVIKHNATNSVVDNITGDLIIQNQADDSDISFRSDDGSGGVTEYFRVDGGNEQIQFSKEIKVIDSVKIKVGSGGDLQLVHNGSSSIIQNSEGPLVFTQNVDDGEMQFKCDDGSGGTTAYMTIDGGDERVNFSKNAGFSDNVKAMFGDGLDLRIYHDGSNSYIEDLGTGNLVINAAARLIINDNADFIKDAEVNLYFDGSKKFETTSTGTLVTGDLEIANSSDGIILESPNGTRFRVTVDNSGNLSTTSL